MDGNTILKSNGSSTFDNPLLVGVVLYSTTASLSLILNLFVVFLFIRRNRLLCNPHNRCILNLSMTDILVSISILTSPDFVFGEAFFNTKQHSNVTRELYCRVLWNKCLTYMFAVTSLYTSVVLSFERWLAVKHSVFYKNQFKVCHMNFLIMASWIVGIITVVPTSVLLVEGVYDKPAQNCQFVLVKNKSYNILLATGQFLFQLVVPLLLITFAYIDVFRGIKISLRFAVSARAENINGIKRLKKVTKVAAITTIVLLVCWVPNTVLYFVSLLVQESPEDYSNPFVFVFSLLTFCNGSINPCIYVFSNPDLKNALKDIFY